MAPENATQHFDQWPRRSITPAPRRANIHHSMDRLARNLDDLRSIVRRLTDKKVRVEFVKEQLSFTGDDNAMATLLLNVMGAFAEFERSLIRERQREGIALAKNQEAWRLPRPHSVAGHGPRLGAARAGCRWRSESCSRSRLWDQPRNRLRLPPR